MIEIQKNSREVKRISEAEYEGHKFVDLRVWYNYNGEMKPTKKGISFNPSKAKEVVEGILSVVEKANWDSFND